MAAEKSTRHQVQIEAAQREAAAARDRHARWISRAPTRHVAAPGISPPDASTLVIPGFEQLVEMHRGGQGVIYRAVQTRTGRTVAIKLMREGALAGPAERARFEREIRILARLKHPNIVPIYDSGEASGWQYFVMDYITGMTLDQFVSSQALDVPSALELFARVCEAVDAAHVRGVIHRDLKPDNIRVDVTGAPHVLDFGLAKQPEDDDPLLAHTLTGQFVGSLPWASPEQVSGDSRDMDMRSDVYSLGVILHQLLTGQHPYPIDGSFRDLIERITSFPPRPLRSVRRDLDEEVETIVLRCLAKEPNRRYQTAGELARDVRSYLAGEVISAKRDSGWYVLRKQLRRYRGSLLIASAFVALLLISSVVSWLLFLDADTARRREQARLWESYVAQARAERSGDRVGRKAASLEAIRAARAIRNDAALRDEAIASLAICDLELRQSLPVQSGFMGGLRKLDRYAARTTDESIEICRLDSGQPFARLPAPEPSSGGWRFSPDGNYLAIRFSVRDEHEVWVWNVASGARVVRVADRARGLFGPRDFGPDSTWFACVTAGGDGMIFDLPEGVSREPICPPKPIAGLYPAPDGERLALVSYDGEGVWIWDMSLGAVVDHLEAPAAMPSVAWSPDGRWIAAGATDHRIYLWDLPAGGEPRVLVGHQAQVVALAFDRDSTLLASSGWDGQARVWNVASGAPLAAPLVGYSLGAFDDSLALAGPDGITLWSVAAPQVVRTIHLGGSHEQVRLAAPQHGAWFVSTGQRGTQIWRCDRNDPPINLALESSRLPCISRDGRRAYAFTARGIAGWALDATDRTFRPASLALNGIPPGLRELGLTSDGTALLGVHQSAVKWFDLASGRVTRSISLVPGAIEPLVNAPQTHLFVGNWKGLAGGHLVDLRDDRIVRTFEDEHVTGEFSQSGELLAVSDRSSVSLWDVNTETMRWTVPRRKGTGLASPLAIAPDARTMALTFSQYELMLVDAVSGRPLANFPNPELQLISDLAFADDGRYLMVATTAGTISIWDLQTLHARLREMQLDW